MKSNRKRRRRGGSRAKRVVRRSVAAGGTVTLAALGLTNCDNGGGGVVDPPPPPQYVCSDVDEGQNIFASGSLSNSTLTINLYAGSVDADTLYVENVAGATLDSLDTTSKYLTRAYFTLASETTRQVTFTFAGTFILKAGPCDFSRQFTVTIDSGTVKVARRSLPLGTERDVRIALVERDGLRVRLNGLGALDGTPTWTVTAGSFEPEGRSGIVWQLPADPGFYQVELLVDRGERGVAFDALSFEVT